MNSWENFFPGYEIKLWNEDNFNLDKYPFARQAYEQKKYAFVADVARLAALKAEGGIYLDTDIEVLKSFDNLLDLELFMGFEQPGVIQTGVIGSKPNHPIVISLLEYYSRKHGFDPNIDGTIANSTLFADYFYKLGYSLDDKTIHSSEFSLFASECFCPINQATQEITVTPETYCIHYLAGSWLPRRDRITRSMKSLIGNLIGYKNVERLRNILISR